MTHARNKLRYQLRFSNYNPYIDCKDVFSKDDFQSLVSGMEEVSFLCEDAINAIKDVEKNGWIVDRKWWRILGKRDNRWRVVRILSKTTSGMTNVYNNITTSTKDRATFSFKGSLARYNDDVGAWCKSLDWS
jgi:hypothetical protein